MKSLTITLVVCLYYTACFAQRPEFTLNSNGLIYSEQTVSQLKRIVDSLNLKFKSCDLHKTYYSQLQGMAHFVEVENDVKAALKDIRNGISLEAFQQKYPHATIIKDLPVIAYEYEDNDGKKITGLNAIDLGDRDPSISFEEPAMLPQPLKNKWIYEYTKKSKYADESLQAFIPVNDFKSIQIPGKYARLIQYSDCLVDTNTTILLEDAKSEFFRANENQSPCLKAFYDHLNTLVKTPEYKDNAEEFEREYNQWDSMRFIVLDKAMLQGITRQLFEDALSEALTTGGSNPEFEEYVIRYASPASALQLKRMRKVIGRCSQDSGPRDHAFDIALLSAETINWEIFLRAHLDIMNDRFERASDGNYAYAARQTYLKELEVLDINVHDLLLGISFRIENPSQNHYFGSIGRIGRALAETKDPDLIESRLMDMIKDPALDDYNRCIFYFLLTHYVYHQPDGPRRQQNKEKMKLAAASLPAYIAGKMKPIEW